MSLSEEDLARVQSSDKLLSISALKTLPKERRFTAIRLWIRQAGYRMPRFQDLLQVQSDLIDAKADSLGIVNVRDYVLRRYRDHLYLLNEEKKTVPFHYEWTAPFEPLYIQESGHHLTIEACQQMGLSLPSHGALVVRNRKGGELIKLGDPPYHKAVKKLLQEAGIPPWEREQLPLIYQGDRLVAVWQVAASPVSDEKQSSHRGETVSFFEE